MLGDGGHGGRYDGGEKSGWWGLGENGFEHVTEFDRSPTFSVVVPTFNRAGLLQKVLEALRRQVPDDLSFELVVVDDGSSDGTSEVIDAFETTRFTLVALRQENAGPAMARNHGLAAAIGRYVLFTGDDIEPAPDLLAQHLEAHRTLPDDRWAVLGRVSWAPELQLTSTMQHVDGVGAQQFSYHFMEDGAEYDFRHFYTANVSTSRRLLEQEFGGFSSDFSAAAFEDAEFALRLSRRGMRIIYHAAAQAYHHHPYDARAFFKRQEACGRMAAVFVRKWPSTMRVIGAHQVWRSRVRETLEFGARRRHVRWLAGRLDEIERRAIELAAAYDQPPTSLVDPLLHSLFRYAFLKGLAFAMTREPVATRLCAFWSGNLVAAGMNAFKHAMEREGRDHDAELIRRLTAELFFYGADASV
jgi:GT2 family glycosyltransferase